MPAWLFYWDGKKADQLVVAIVDRVFTFLTGYAYLSGKFSNCGCFGDCIPISSKASFLKDVALLVLILLLFFNRKHIQPVFATRTTRLLLLISAVLSLGIQWYTLHYLPVLDCLPFKVGSYIPDKLKVPANAIPDSTEITFVYEKAGKKMEFNADHFPDDFNDSTYKFIDRYDKVIRKGTNAIPEIRGFDFQNSAGTTITQDILDVGYAVLLFHEDRSIALNKWEKGFEGIYQSATGKIFRYISSAAWRRW